MATDHTETMRRELEDIRAELSALKNRTGELETRLLRLEVKEELMESPAAAGDQAVTYR